MGLIPIILLLLVSERPVSSSIVIVPALLVTALFTAAMQSKKKIKLRWSVCPFAFGSVFSLWYIFTQFRIYDPALKEILPFSAVIKNQAVNILISLVLSFFLFLWNYKKKSDNSL